MSRQVTNKDGNVHIIETNSQQVNSMTNQERMLDKIIQHQQSQNNNNNNLKE